MSDIQSANYEENTAERLRRLRSLVKVMEATSDKVSKPVGTQFFKPQVPALPSN